MPGFPIQTSADQFVFANPRSFSQLITSFFASESLGIPHTPLFTSSHSYPPRSGQAYVLDYSYTITSIFFSLLFLHHVNELLVSLLAPTPPGTAIPFGVKASDNAVIS